MFKELNLVTLTAPISIKRIWDIPGDSPLLKNNEHGEGLLPGDVGTIVHVQDNGEAFEVEFLEPSGYTVAIATIYPYILLRCGWRPNMTWTMTAFGRKRRSDAPYALRL